MAIVLQTMHTSTGLLQFDDNEVVEVAPRQIQRVVEQESQTGNLSATYIGQDRFEWDITFDIFYRSTQVKLHQLFVLQDEFTLWPLLLESPMSTHTVRWIEEQFLERYARGRMLAAWEKTVTWKEIVTGTCPDILVS